MGRPWFLGIAGVAYSFEDLFDYGTPGSPLAPNATKWNQVSVSDFNPYGYSPVDGTNVKLYRLGGPAADELNTFGKFSFLYGSYEARWDWEQESSAGWACVMSLLDAPTGANNAIYFQGRFHEDRYHFRTRVGGSPTDTYITKALHPQYFTPGFHTAKIVWSPGQALLFLDGVQEGNHITDIPSVPMLIRIRGQRYLTGRQDVLFDYVRVW